MDFLSTPQSIYETLTAKAENVWVTVYPDPGGKNNCLFAGEGDPSDQWHLVESIIRNAASRYNRFKIRVALGAKNAMPQEIPVQVVGQAAQVAGIGSVPGVSMGVYGYGQHADIGKLLDERDEKWKKELEHRDALRERDDKIAALEYENRQKKKKGDFWEQATIFCQETGVDPNPIIAGLINKLPQLFGRSAQRAMPGLAGVPGAEIHRKPASRPVPTHEDETGEQEPDNNDEMSQANYEAMNEAVQKELLFNGERDESILNIEFASVVDATIRLHQFFGGMRTMGLIGDDLQAASALVDFADFIISNPQKAQELIKQAKGENTTA